MPRGDPVHRVGVIRDLDAPNRQLLPESYRARSAAQGRFERLEAFRQVLRRADQKLPEALPHDRVTGGEDLAAAGVQHRQALALAGVLAEGTPERIERADAAHRYPAGETERPRRGDADAQPGEGAWPDPDRDPIDRRPAAGRRDRALDLSQQRRGVQGRTAVGGTEPRLVQDLAVADRAGGGVSGGAVEADDGQRGTRKLNTPTRLPATNQLTRCLPGMLVLISLT